MKKPLQFLLPLVALITTSLAAPRPALVLGVTDDDGFASALQILIIDGSNDAIVEGKPINIPRSRLADPAGTGITITATKDNHETDLGAPTRVTAPDFDGDGFTGSVTVHTSEKLDGETIYGIRLAAAGGQPALTFGTGGGETVMDSLDLKMAYEDAISADLVDHTALDHSIEFGGGGDGSLIALKLRYGEFTMEERMIMRLSANLEADISPSGADSDSLIYGKVLGEVHGIMHVPFRDDGILRGAGFYGLHGNIDSDQDFDNWDAAVGLTAWWFINSDAIDGLGRLLNLSGDEDTPVHPISLKVAGHYIYESEREDPMADPEEIRVTSRLIWLPRIYSGARLPLMDTKFDINLRIDASAAWEPDAANVHPSARFGLEFSPIRFEDKNLAFTLTYAKGKFSPTFVDEDAFLAGLKFKF